MLLALTQYLSLIKKNNETFVFLHLTSEVSGAPPEKQAPLTSPPPSSTSATCRLIPTLCAAGRPSATSASPTMGHLSRSFVDVFLPMVINPHFGRRIPTPPFCSSDFSIPVGSLPRETSALGAGLRARSLYHDTDVHRVCSRDHT